MRREQVLKICANHSILPDMNWVWFAQDFSDGDLKKEQFTAKFKTKEIAQEFFKVFQKCQSNLKEIANKNEKPEIDKSQSDTCTENKTAFDELFKPEIDKSQSDACTGNKTAYDELFKPVANSWECSKCKKSNMNESSCVYCSTPKSGTSVVIGKSCLVSKQKPLSELFKLRKSSWKCKVCYLRNKSCDAECVSCNSPKPSSSDTFNKNAISSNQDTQPISYVKNNKSETLTNLFKPLAGTEKTSPFSLGSNKPSSGDFGMKPITQFTTFSFGLSSVVGEGSEIVGFKPTLPTSNIPSVFGWTTQKSDLSEKKSFTIPQTTSAPTDAFGNATSTFILNSGSPAGKEADSSSVEFRFGSTAKFEYNFSGVRPRSSTKTPVSPKLLSTPSDVDEGDSFDADNPYFQPVIPLPPKQDYTLPHTAQLPQQGLQGYDILSWPARSPDLSPIEHVWDMLRKKLPPEPNVVELTSQLERIWHDLLQHVIGDLLDLIPYHVWVCVAARGGCTTYRFVTFPCHNFVVKRSFILNL
ncbi:E3 SUMO-protein ligase RanBP2, partial [Stegodyphus mimosarum]